MRTRDDQQRLQAVSAELEQRLVDTPWATDTPAADPQVGAAAEVAAFALGLSGKRRAARRGGRLSRVLMHFALAATVALSSVVAACGPTNPSGPPAVDVASLASANASEVTIAAPTRGSPGRFVDMVLLDLGTDSTPWAVLVPKTDLAQPSPTPILVDRQGADLTTLGGTYSLPAQVVAVGTRDGASQFLDPLDTGVETTSGRDVDYPGVLQRVQAGWQKDERFQAATRAITGQPTVLDAAYNAEAAVTAGGTHTYSNGVVLRVDPDNPAVQVIDRSLLQSGVPTRAEDLVTVAIRPEERSLYEPGSIVNLRDVVMQKQQSDVNGQSATFYLANAALQGARLEATGERVDLQNLLQSRLQRTDADLAVQAQELSQPGAVAPGVPTPTPGAQPTAQPQQVTVNNNTTRYSGPSFVDDFLIWMWLSHSGFYRGPNVVIVNPPPSPTRPTGDYYYTPPASGTSGSSTSGSGGAAGTTSRSTALQSARNAVSGQASGTGGGTAATTKSAADATSRASAATDKSSSLAGQVSSASAGKSTSSVAPPASSSSSAASSAARSAGSVSAGSRGTSSSSSSRGGSSSSSGGGFGSSGGGKGISGSSSS